MKRIFPMTPFAVPNLCGHSRTGLIHAAFFLLPILLMFASSLSQGADDSPRKRITRKIGSKATKKETPTPQPPPAAPASPAPEANPPAPAAGDANPPEPTATPTEAPSDGPVTNPTPPPEEESVIGLPTAEGGSKGGTKIDLGLESQEKGTVGFYDIPGIKELLPNKPKFVYDAEKSADPMVFPPVRNEAIRLELWNKHLELLKQAGVGKNPLKPDRPDYDLEKVSQAITAVKGILGLNDVRFKQETEQEIATLTQLLHKEEVDQSKKPPDEEAKKDIAPPLDDWVKANTRGIIAGVPVAMCLVGDDPLKVGDEVPDYPNHTVASISPGVVTFKTVSPSGKNSQTYDVKVEGIEEPKKGPTKGGARKARTAPSIGRAGK